MASVQRSLTWDEIRRHLAERYGMLAGGDLRVEGKLRGARFCAELKADAGSTELVAVRLTVRVCGESRLSPREALRINAVLRAGSLGLEGDYLLRRTLPLDGATLEEIDRTLDYFARVARTLHAQVTPSPGLAMACFSSYAQ